MRYTPSTGVFCCAVVVSKKVCKLAVDRNRLRRKVYTALQGLSDVLPQFLLVIQPTASVAELPTTDITTLLGNALADIQDEANKLVS